MASSSSGSSSARSQLAEVDALLSAAPNDPEMQQLRDDLLQLIALEEAEEQQQQQQQQQQYLAPDDDDNDNDDLTSSTELKSLLVSPTTKNVFYNARGMFLEHSSGSSSVMSNPNSTGIIDEAPQIGSFQPVVSSKNATKPSSSSVTAAATTTTTTTTTTTWKSDNDGNTTIIHSNNLDSNTIITHLDPSNNNPTTTTLSTQQSMDDKNNNTTTTTTTTTTKKKKKQKQTSDTTTTDNTTTDAILDAQFELPSHLIPLESDTPAQRLKKQRTARALKSKFRDRQKEAEHARRQNDWKTFATGGKKMKKRKAGGGIVGNTTSIFSTEEGVNARVGVISGGGSGRMMTNFVDPNKRHK